MPVQTRLMADGSRLGTDKLRGLIWERPKIVVYKANFVYRSTMDAVTRYLHTYSYIHISLPFAADLASEFQAFNATYVSSCSYGPFNTKIGIVELLLNVSIIIFTTFFSNAISV
jgi:hypothetical protein